MENNWNDEIESAIDSMGLSEFLSAVASICEEKRDHIASNWQDSGAATSWGKAAARIDRLAGDMAILDKIQLSKQ